MQFALGQTWYYTYSASFAPEASNFVRRGYGSAIVLGDSLYYDAGDIWQLVDGYIYGAPNNSTLSIDLTIPWNNQTVQFKVTNKTEQRAQTWNGNYLWPDPAGDTFYQWGGASSILFLNRDIPPSQLYQFRPGNNDTGQWTQRAAAANSVIPSRGQDMAMAYDNVDTAYFLGGYGSPLTDPKYRDQVVFSGTMLAYNASTNTWINSSATGLTPWPNALQKASMRNVPFASPNGLNMIFSGYSSDTVVDGGHPLLGLDTVYIHDPATSLFWNQTTTSASGSFPQPRVSACSVAMQGSNGTFEIFLFGGDDRSNSPEDNILMSDAVWVLSLPSFVWFKADYAAKMVRYTHICKVAPQASSQMIVMGGINGWYIVDVNETDPWTNGLNVFDLNNMAWRSDFNPQAPAYSTPEVITNHIRDSGPLPESWDYQEVQDLFATFLPSRSSSSSPSPASSSSSSPSAASSPSKGGRSRVGSIAGGVVGGVVCLACLALVGWYLLRKWRRPGTRAREGDEYEKAELPSSSRANSITYKRHHGLHEADANDSLTAIDGDTAMASNPNAEGRGKAERWELPT